MKIALASLPQPAALGDAVRTLLQRARVAADAQRRGRLARVVEVQSFGPTSKIAVVEFGGRNLLLSVARNGITLIAADDGA